jgi:hypothetical protein
MATTRRRSVADGIGEVDRVDPFPRTPSSATAAPATLVDTNATFAARMLMQDLVTDYGRITWSGQHETNDAISC